MNELRAIVKRWNQLHAAGQTAALASVVAVQGSAFRRVGARMLITTEGEIIGGVSGGCIENDVIERAQQVIREGHAVVAEYDTRKDDPLLGIGTGCHGIIQVLISPLGNEGAADDAPHLQWIAEASRGRRSAALATLVAPVGREMPRVERALWTSEGLAAGGFSDVKVADLAQAEAKRVLAAGGSFEQPPNARDSLGESTLLVEFIPAPIALLVFGAGHDAIPLVHFASGLGWEISVIDHRAAWASPERFPLADRIITARPSELDGQLQVDERTAAVVMMHQFEHDLALLKKLLPTDARYIGILGSRDRTRRLWDDLRAEMDVPSSQIAGRVFGPVGLDLGARSPDEIALSIVAEIQAVFGGRSGKIHSLSSPPR